MGSIRRLSAALRSAVFSTVSFALIFAVFCLVPSLQGCVRKGQSPARDVNPTSDQNDGAEEGKVCLDTLSAICRISEDDPCGLGLSKELRDASEDLLRQMGYYFSDQDAFFLKISVAAPYSAVRTMNVITTNDGRREFRLPALLADDACLIAFHEDYEIDRYEVEEQSLYLTLKRHQVVNLSHCPFVEHLCFPSQLSRSGVPSRHHTP